jgi:integrative and conjugative element protein (TIGR02256 family)
VSSVIHNVKYSDGVLETIHSQIQKFRTIETGGVLMGHLENGILFIEKASEPGPNATHEPTYFRADANYVDMYIDIEVANSNGKDVYLGEWHTHPQINPEPSPVDGNSLMEIAASSEEFAVLLIIGAIKFSKELFARQHILLLKYKNDGRFFRL